MPIPKKNESKQDFLKRCTTEVVAQDGDSKQAYAVCNSFWDNDKSQRSSLSLSLPVELKEGEPGTDTKRFLITAYTGQVVERFWGGGLVIDVSGIKTKKKLPVLREHERDRVVGYGASWQKDNNLYIEGAFSKKTPDGKEVLELAEEGYPWQASIGVKPLKVKVLDDDKQSHKVNGEEVFGPMEIWQQSQVGEVSFVSLGADDETAAISFSEDKVNVKIDFTDDNSLIEESEKMTEILIDLEYLKANASELLEQITNEAFSEGQVSERNRVTEILEAGGEPDVALKCIKDGIEAGQVYKMFFEAEKSKLTDKLEKMETQAPESVGQPEPVVEEDGFAGPPDEVAAERAIALMDKEGLSYELALNRVFEEDPKLAEAYKDSYNV